MTSHVTQHEKHNLSSVFGMTRHSPEGKETEISSYFILQNKNPVLITSKHGIILGCIPQAPLTSCITSLALCTKIGSCQCPSPCSRALHYHDTLELTTFSISVWWESSSQGDMHGCHTLNLSILMSDCRANTSPWSYKQSTDTSAASGK